MTRSGLGNILLVFLAAFPAWSAVAQSTSFLLLEKAGTSQRIRYYPGDEIRFILAGEDDSIKSGVISAISDSSFFLTSKVSVRLDEVEAIAIARSGFFKGVQGSALYAIPAILVLSAANNHFNTGRSPLIDESAIQISGVFAVIGLAAFIPGENKIHKLKNRKRLIAVIH